MSLNLIECVPNFSEGRNQDKIRQIVDAIASDSKIALLGCDPGAGANRTVVTFAGSPDAVLAAAFRGIERAADIIDMRQHRGVHERIGATDVCPLVPLGEGRVEDCIPLARALGARVGRDLGIPVYLYGAAATRAQRRRLVDVRRGEYEALVSRLGTAAGAPDYGPATFNPRTGATAVGARRILIAWNVNIDATDPTTANRIAGVLRESGAPTQVRRGATGPNTRSKRVPGRFKGLQGRGWFIPEYGCAQISFNLLDYRRSSLHDVFGACDEEAAKMGCRVAGSELVGLVPLEALLMAGAHYLGSGGGDEAVLVAAAIDGLGLNAVRPFKPDEQIIEYALKRLPAGANQ